MASKRVFASATLLQDGRVLIAGGQNANGVLSTSEIYDPMLDVWLPGPAIPGGRTGQTAIALQNGTVMLLRGYVAFSPPPPTIPVLVYDPADGMWHTAAGADESRVENSATLLDNGKVLIVGGYDQLQIPGAKLFDPSTGALTNAGTMVAKRFDHVAVKLADGRVLVAGGSTSTGASTATASSEIYDPDMNTWSAASNLGFARQSAAAVLLMNGKVLIAGGVTDNNPVAMSELYDPGTNAWTPSGALAGGGADLTATLLPDGTVLAAGGFGSAGAAATAEVFDPQSNSWTDAGSMRDARSGHTATLLPNGRVLVAGGAGLDYLRSADQFNGDLLFSSGFD
jgi:N-acetylneuraminic acid mutarotase